MNSGIATGAANNFTLKKVMLLRRAYGLKKRYERLRESGMLTVEEVAQL